MRKLLATVAITSGLGLGAMTLDSVVSAQTYGGDGDSGGTEEPAPDPQEPVVDDSDAPVTPTEPIVEALQVDGTDGSGEAGRSCGGRGLDAAAETIGIEPSALRAAVDSGQTLAEVAVANDVDPDAVVAAMVAHSEERLAQKVADGRITQAEADERLAEKTQRITERVTGGDA